MQSQIHTPLDLPELIHGFPRKMIAHFTPEYFNKIMEECRVSHLRKTRAIMRQQGRAWTCECGITVDYHSRFCHVKTAVHTRKMDPNGESDAHRKHRKAWIQKID
jgi:hypothetical protein